jgi:hypothetical protein
MNKIEVVGHNEAPMSPFLTPSNEGEHPKDQGILKQIEKSGPH